MELAPPAVQENVEVELADVAGPAAAVCEDNGDVEAQLGENIFHDVGTWPQYVPDELRVERVRRGLPEQRLSLPSQPRDEQEHEP